MPNGLSPLFIVLVGILYVWGAGYCLGRVRDEALRGDGSSKRSVHTHEHIQAQLLGSQTLPSSVYFLTNSNNSSSGNDNEKWMSEDCCIPTSLPFFIRRKVQQVAVGDTHICVKSGLELFAWGMNGSGQLGEYYFKVILI
jgi:alpha-tubulin suppressor-like RCC1 family protein